MLRLVRGTTRERSQLRNLKVAARCLREITAAPPYCNGTSDYIRMCMMNTHTETPFGYKLQIRRCRSCAHRIGRE